MIAEHVYSPANADGCELVALVLRGVAAAPPAGVRFHTDPKDILQVGTVSHPAGHVVPPHEHAAVRRAMPDVPPECLLLLSGRVRVDLYATGCREPFASRELAAGDAVILYGGGHGFTMLEAAALFEVRLGPYLGPGADKRRFLPGVADAAPR